MSILTKLADRDLELFRAMAEGGFVHGHCYEFAIALHRGTGWPLVGLMNGQVIEHAGVQEPNGLLRDGRGANTQEDFSVLFSLSSHICFITEKNLYAIRQIYEHSIDLASRVAQSLWPDLPWKPDTFQKRVLAFTEEIEKISRAHGLWIRAPMPGCLPIISEGDELEGGYRISPTLTASEYVFNRYFKSEIPRYQKE